MNPPHQDLETDPRFPSGRWTGFFLDKRVKGKHTMELLLTFGHGELSGEGRDFVGKFIVRGRYSVEDGKCHFHKRYLKGHDIFYEGFNEGKGIWGKWQLMPPELYGIITGGFHIWPEGLGDPTMQTLTEKADVPSTRELVEVGSDGVDSIRWLKAHLFQMHGAIRNHDNQAQAAGQRHGRRCLHAKLLHF